MGRVTQVTQSFDSILLVASQPLSNRISGYAAFSSGPGDGELLSDLYYFKSMSLNIHYYPLIYTYPLQLLFQPIYTLLEKV